MKGDILYLDPPYNQRQYATNYTSWKQSQSMTTQISMAKLDYAITNQNLLTARGQVKKAFKDLIDSANKIHILSYNNEGLMTPADIKKSWRRVNMAFYSKIWQV